MYMYIHAHTLSHSHTCTHTESLSWRDMWALVAVKGGEGGVVGEDVGKSASVQSWGITVNLKVTVPLTDDG